MHLRNLRFAALLLLAALGAAPAFARTDVAITVSGTSSSPGEIALVGGLPPSGAPYWVVYDGSGAEVASGSGSTTLSLPTGSYSVEWITTFTEDGNSYQDISGQFDWASGTWAWLNGSSSSTDVPDGPVENWIPFDEPQGWVAGPWTPDASTVWEDQTFTQNRTDTQLHLNGERSSLNSSTRNLGSYTEYSVLPPQTNVPGTRPLNPRVVSSSEAWGAWSGSAPAETADNPPWSWGSWSPSPGWYWEDQPATTTTQTRTGTRTVTYTTASYTQTRTGTRTENWTNDRGNTWVATSGLSGSQTIPASTRTEAQSTPESQSVGDTPRALNPRHVLATGAWQDFSAWTPDTDTVPAGQAFTQTQTFRRWLTDYWTNDRGDIWSDVSSWESGSDSRPATGTGAVPNSAPTSSLTGSTTLTALQSGTWNFSAADVDGNLAQWRFYNTTNPGAAYSPITTGSSVSGTHTQSFATAGSQTWKLDVMDADGATVTKTLTVTVNPAPQASVTLTPAGTSVTAGGSATFTASGGSGSGAYTWGGTGGATGTGTSRTLTFPTAGTFTVTAFRAGDATYAASGTTSVSVTVTAAADTVAPSAPTGLATTFVAAASFTLSWAASTDNVGIAGYEVRLDGGVPVSANGAGGLSHAFSGLAFNSTHVAEVRARDAAGNLSGWSAHTAATSSGSTGLNNGQSAWLDVDGDGIRDEIVPANSADFTYTIVQWFSVESLPANFQPNDFWFNFDAVYIDADGGRIFEGFSQIFAPTPVTLTETWFELVFNFRTLAGRPYSIYTDTVSQPDANLVFPLNPAVWTLLLQSGTPPATDGSTTYSTTFFVAEEFVGAQFFHVRKGLSLNFVQVELPGGVTFKVGANGQLGSLTLPDGTTVSVTTSGGSVTLPDGTTITLNGGVASVSSTGTLTSGQTVTLSGTTVALDSNGNVVITFPDATEIKLNPDGGGSLTFPGGIGVSVSAEGTIGLILPPGTPPIIVKAVNVAGQVLQGASGVTWVKRDIFGQIFPIGVLDQIDIGLTNDGEFQLGVKLGESLLPVWFTHPPKPKVEFVRDQDDDHSVGLPDPALPVLRIGHWGADRTTDGGLTGFTEGVFGTPRNELSPENFIDQDPDRFHVRLIAPAANVNSGVADTVLVSIRTSRTSGSEDDASNDLTLRESGPDSGIFVSEAQLLVGPDVPTSTDDDFPVRSAITGLARSDDTRDDRTHRAEVHGSVTATYRVGSTDYGVTAPVFSLSPGERHVLHVVLTTFNEPWQDANANGQFDQGEPFVDVSGGASAFATTGTWGPIWSDEQIDVQMAGLRSVLASAGIVVVEDARRIVQPVGTLFQQPDAVGAPATTALFDVAQDRHVQFLFPSRDHQLINANYRSASHSTTGTGDDVLDVYFVPPFDEAGWGFSFYPKATSFVPAVPVAYLNSAFVSYGAARETIPTLLAHEVLHHLTNQGDIVTPRHIVFPNSNGSASEDGASPSWQRRIQAATADQARALRPDPDLLATGNNLLRTP